METNFNNFKNEGKKNKKVKKITDPENLQSEILLVQNDEGYEKVTEPMEIVQITGVLSEEESEKIKENHVVHAGSSFTDGDLKRGQTIYLTALLKKPGTSYSAQQQGVIQCRVVDIFLGLSKLNSIMK